MPSPALTILLPTFRRPRLLARALHSILAQTWGDFTVLVCDNASADETGAVVAGFMARDRRITYHRHPTDIGPQANFAWAFAQVRSDYFCMLSDDDILLPDCLAVEMRGMERHPQAMAWGGTVLLVGGGGCVGAMPAPGWPDGYCGPAEACARVCANVRPQNTGMLFRRAVLDGDFHPGQADFHASDVLWTLHAAAKGGIGVTRTPVAVFTQHPGSTSTRAGLDLGAAIRLHWPSALYLQDHFPRGCLSEVQFGEFRRQALVTYGSEPFRRLGRRAAVCGLQAELALCLDHLEHDLQDAAGAAVLRRLARFPAPLLRLYDGVRHRLRLLAGACTGDRGALRREAQAAIGMLEAYGRLADAPREP